VVTTSSQQIRLRAPPFTNGIPLIVSVKSERTTAATAHDRTSQGMKGESRSCGTGCSKAAGDWLLTLLSSSQSSHKSPSCARA